MNDSQQQQADAELVGCKVAYESGVHWLDANVRALEALRTRSLTLVSVVLIAATLVASLAPDAVKQDALGGWGRAGGVIFAVGMAVLCVLTACVSWPPEDHQQTHNALPDVALGQALQGAGDRPGWLCQRIAREAQRASTALLRKRHSHTHSCRWRCAILDRCHLLKLNPDARSG